jgi:hypothetical protein
MSDEKKRLERVESTSRDSERGEGRGERRRRGRGQRRSKGGQGPLGLGIDLGRSSVREDVMLLQKGVMFAGIEAAAASMDIAQHLLRNAVDRTFSHDYRNPGDVVRALTRDATETVGDALDEVKDVPQRVNDSFYEAVPKRRSVSKGERYRRAMMAKSGDETDSE